MCKRFDKGIVVVGKAKELLNTLDALRWLPVQDSSHLVRIHSQFTRTHHMSKILDIWLDKFAFLQLGLQLVLAKSVGDLAKMSLVLFCVVTINEYIIKVNQNEVINVTKHYHIHKILECRK